MKWIVLVLAGTFAISAGANELATMGVLDFIAPTVNNVSNIISTQDGGTIVYDADDGLFKGKNWDSTWQVLSPSSNVTSVVAVSGSTTLTSANDVVLCDANSATLTLTLPGVSTLGKVVIIKKTDTSFNAVVIDGAGAELIEGEADVTLNTENEMIRLVSNGSQWKIVERNIPSEWKTYTPSFTGSGWTTTGSVTFFWRRVGDSVQIKGSFTSSATDTNEGRIGLPTSGSVSLTSAGSTKIATLEVAGNFARSALNAEGNVVLMEQSKTYVTVGRQSSGTGSLSKEIGNNLAGNFAINATVPIAGWGYKD